MSIGLFVYFRRGTAYKAQHFYIFCLVSFIFCTFHYTGKLNNFDKLIYWGNVVAGMLAPVIFVHFCLSFPEPRRWLRFRVPTVGLYGIAGSMVGPLCSGQLGDAAHFDPAGRVALAARPHVAGAADGDLHSGRGRAQSSSTGKPEDPIVRRQLKWLRNGTFCGDPAVRAFLRSAVRDRHRYLRR